MSANSDLGAYVVRESIIAGVVTAAISVAVAWALFRDQAILPGQALIIDAVPQTFMSALLSAIIPTLLTGKRVASGALAPTPARTKLPRNVFLRAVLLAVAATMVGVALTAAIVLAFVADGLDLTTALWVKGMYGGIVGFVVGVFAVQAALADEPSRTES